MRRAFKNCWRLLGKVQVFLVVMLIFFPATGFGESEISINIGPTFEPQLSADQLPTLNTYLPDAAEPPLRCARSGGQALWSRIAFPSDTSATYYVFLAFQGTDAEQLACGIANDPTNTALIEQGEWSDPNDVPDLPAFLSISVSGSASALVLLVGDQTGDYTLVGPVSGDYYLKCCRTSVPATDQWGLILFGGLLLALALRFAGRKQTS